MKTSIAVGLTLAILAPTAVFASPEKVTRHAVVTTSSIVALDSKAASTASVKPFDSKSTDTVVVAENRKEFGSKYQRY